MRPHGMVALLALAGSLAKADTEGSCGNLLKPDPRSKYGYIKRGDRCEGIFAKPVSGTVFPLLSLTMGLVDYSKDKEGDLLVFWPHFNDDSIHIRAIWLRQRSYYQMDTEQKGASSPYTWNAEILRDTVPPTQLGIVASTIQFDRTVYLPVLLALKANPPKEQSPGKYQLRFLPTQMLKNIAVTIAPVDSKGDSEAPFVENRSLELGPVPANFPLMLELDCFSGRSTGIYSVLISAETTQGKPVSSDFYFYHHAPTK